MSNNDVSACSLMTDYLDSIGAGKILVDGATFIDFGYKSCRQGQGTRSFSLDVHGNRLEGVSGRAVVMEVMLGQEKLY